MQLWDEFENLFARKVDLLTEQSLKNTFLRDSVEKTRKLIYERGK
jgi:predicted nucleotidyltransferase